MIRRGLERAVYVMKKVDNYIWSGRTDHLENRASFGVHQIIEKIQLEDLTSLDNACAIIGFECDEGVQRNKGQSGAATAPNELRKELSKIPWKLAAEKRLIDLGNIECVGSELEQAQQQLGSVVSTVLSKKVTPIILGGGHETAYGHYLGVRDYIGSEASLGIINIDAHFDLRTYEEQSSSGTMFRQILEHDKNSHYFVVGIQRFGNIVELFDKADELGVNYLYEEDVTSGPIDETLTALELFMDKHDFVLLTLCTDVLNAAFAPGVSAPSPFGLNPSIVRSIIRTVASNKKTLSFDISEVNPTLDENNRTVKLGAYLTNEAITSFLS